MDEYELFSISGHLGLVHVPCGATCNLNLPWDLNTVMRTALRHVCGRAW